MPRCAGGRFPLGVLSGIRSEAPLFGPSLGLPGPKIYAKILAQKL